MKPTISLSNEQVEFFHREGYLAIPSITTQEEVARIREIYDRLFAQRAGRSEGNQFDLAGTDEEGKEAVMPQILGLAKYAPELDDTLLKVNATAVIRRLTEESATCEFGHAIYKPPRISPATPWHQDSAYWNPDFDYPGSLSVWVPLQEATIENGCMWFMPRSHKLDILPHQSIGNDLRVHGLELQPDQLRHVRNPVVCPLPPGGATIHGAFTLHHAGPNKSDIPRRAIILSGGIPWVKRTKPRDMYWLHGKRTLRVARAKAAAGKSMTGPAA